ncbi:alpha/beta fold hydrolase [Geotalea sp. SG265]|uniref:alpha/beta fold hydrolase n=1 Tax=Geotalea sp. SG265 TaxID=2922867 RepID=UPI001FB02340|nr:alpha/beta fold hydrolase [Geotalea sp. SG265]
MGGRLLILIAWFSVIGTLTAAAYDYPVKNPYIATIAGTPTAYKADLKVAVPEKQKEIKIIEGRQVPPIFWFQNRMKYSVAMQGHKAPLMFIIAAAGSSYNSPTTHILQRAFYKAGFHVICLSSPTHPNFMVTASMTGVPGYVPDDARDLYRAMTRVWQELDGRSDVSDFFLTGYSLGAVDAAFVANLDEEIKGFNFRKVLMINPPVSLYTSIMVLDRMLLDNLPGGIAGLNPFVDQVMTKFAGMYRGMEALDFNNDVLYQVFEEEKPDDREMAALIGLSFRLVSANMMVTADIMNNRGYLVPKNKVLSPTDPTTEYLKVGLRLSFSQFFDEFFFPFFQARYPGMTKEALIASDSIKSLDAYLRQTNKIGVMVNADDMILAPGDLEYLTGVFGNRVRIYPLGGHLGNIDYRENVADMLAFFGVTETKQ